MNTTNNDSIKPTKIAKKKGPIRLEAVIPFAIVTAITVLYFTLFFDSHLRKAIEFIGYQVMGAEVNVADLDTSFTKGTFRMRGLQITDASRPSHNMVVIGDVRFGLLWDGLLRARFVIEEMAVEQIEIGTARKSPGKVKPPEPPPKKSNEPSALEKEAAKLKGQALEKVQDKYEGNVFGDIAAMLGGTSGDDQLKNIESQLPSKAKLEAFQKEFQEKQKTWNAKIASLPQGKEIQALGDRLGKVKLKDFKSPQELQNSLQELDAIFKEGDAKFKLIQATGNELNSDMKAFEQGIKDLDAMVKKDIAELEKRFRIPKLDAKSISRSLFQQYIEKYTAQFYHYKGVAEKYIPPNLLKKKDPSADDTVIKPHPRAKGVTYEFGKPNSYPLFWVKKISVSSKAGASKESGDVKGQITNITSNQKLINKPTVAEVSGDFPGMQVMDMSGKIILDLRKDDSLISYDFSVGSYPVEGKTIVDSPDAKLAFTKATGSVKSNGGLLGLANFKFNLDSKFTDINYDISAKNQTVDQVLKDIFKDIPVATIQADGRGELPDLALEIQSNLGAEIQKGFEKQLQIKINEAKAKLQAAIDQALGKEKAKLEADYAKAKSQVDNEVKKVQDQINAQKAQAENKSNQAKKEAENEGKKKLEAEAKKLLGNDGDKKIDDLKKKLGF